MEPLPEGLLWLLLTGEVPTEAEVRQLTVRSAFCMFCVFFVLPLLYVLLHLLLHPLFFSSGSFEVCVLDNSYEKPPQHKFIAAPLSSSRPTCTSAPSCPLTWNP